MINQKQKKVLIMALHAGEIMMKSGAEIYRVEDTVSRICRACDIPYVEVFATPTGIFLSLDAGHADSDMHTFIKRIKNTRIDLEKISKINQFSREFTTTDLSVDEGLQILKRIDHDKEFSFWWRVLGAALITSFFTIMLGGSAADFAGSMLIGVLAYFSTLLFERLQLNSFVSVFCSCVLVALLTLSSIQLGLGGHRDFIIIGSIMMFLPGVAITNAVRDFLSGDSLSGLARASEAIMTAVSIAAGVGVVLRFSGSSLSGSGGSVHLALQFVWAFLATGGFCFIFNVPRRHIPMAGLVGAAGWLVFQYMGATGYSSIMACFIGSCTVALASDICSRVFKEAATLFIIPGILPLVPGAGMYYAMQAFLDSNLKEAARIGWETSLMAGSIAVALLIVSSLIRVVSLSCRELRRSLRKRG